jgi:hypothetical protein
METEIPWTLLGSHLTAKHHFKKKPRNSYFTKKGRIALQDKMASWESWCFMSFCSAAIALYTNEHT